MSGLQTRWSRSLRERRSASEPCLGRLRRTDVRERRQATVIFSLDAVRPSADSSRRNFSELLYAAITIPMGRPSELRKLAATLAEEFQNSGHFLAKSRPGGCPS